MFKSTIWRMLRFFARQLADAKHYLALVMVMLVATAGIQYPLSLSISSGATTFTQTTPPLSYVFKGSANVRFSRHHGFALVVGYRLSNLGSLTAGATPYLTGGAALDLSGLFAGLAINAEF